MKRKSNGLLALARRVGNTLGMEGPLKKNQKKRGGILLGTLVVYHLYSGYIVGISRSWEGISSSNFHYPPPWQRVFSDGGICEKPKNPELGQGAGVHGLKSIHDEQHVSQFAFFRSLPLSQFSYHNLQLPDFWCFWCNDRLMSFTHSLYRNGGRWLLRCSGTNWQTLSMGLMRLALWEKTGVWRQRILC